MNIGFDASRAFIGKKTGTENYSYQILSHLVKLDHNNEPKVPSAPQNKYYIYCRGCACTTLSRGHSTLCPYKFITIPYPRLWTQVGLALQTFKDPLDVLFIPAHTLPIIRKPGLKTVITVHDLGAEYLPQTHQLKQRLYLNFMTYHQLKSADHIIAVSNATKEDIVKKVGISPSKITVIYEGYNQDLFKPIHGIKLSSTLSKYKLENQDYFLFVGTIQPRKNLERLIRAYSLFVGVVRAQPLKGIARNAPTLILAGGKGWLADEIYELPKKLGIADKVKFLGYVPDSDLPALYSGAKAFLFPSLFEGFGLPILEAWACNCPVLTSNISSMEEIVQLDDRKWKIEDSNLKIDCRQIDKQVYPPSSTIKKPSSILHHPLSNTAAILVNPFSVEDIAQGIERIMNHESRIKLSKKGAEQLKNFSWEKAAKETLQVLQNLFVQRTTSF